MRRRISVAFALILSAFLVWEAQARGQSQQRKISSFELGRAEGMLSSIHYSLKKNYYDPSFHGLDIDARYKTYNERLKKAETMGDALRTVAAFFTGLNDSHTFFEPPSRAYRFDYGYRMQMIGDNCFITDVRPGSDAAQKLHPGDQVLSLNGYTVNRADLWQLEYYLNQLAPQPATKFTLRDPSGNVRQEVVNTKYQEGKILKDLTTASGGLDIWQMVRERENRVHLLRHRYVERGDLMIWKMPIFESSESETDHMVGLARKHKALILDLRGNPGGYEATLRYMLGSFVDHEVKIATRVTRKGEEILTTKQHGKSIFTGKLIVLVDGRSASAAELFARVIQLEHAGTVLGDRSSGSVMEARYYPTQEGADILIFFGASITSADLIMSDGKSLEKLGVTPDVVILPTASDIAASRDPALARAVELAGSELDATAAGKLFPFEWASPFN